MQQEESDDDEESEAAEVTVEEMEEWKALRGGIPASGSSSVTFQYISHPYISLYASI